MEMPPGAHSTRARGKGAPFDKDFFTVVFYGPKILRRKTAQFCVTRRKHEIAETPSVRNGAQAGENTPKNSFLNYKSAALNQLSYAGVPIRKLFLAS
jgi:hypothetical protein